MEHSEVLDTRKRPDGTVWRKRICSKCLVSFYTYEITAEELERLRRLDIFERKLVAFADALQAADAISTLFITPDAPANLSKPARQ